MITAKTKRVGIFAIVYFLVALAGAGFVANLILNTGMELEEQAETVQKNELLKQRYAELQKVLRDTQYDRELLKSHILTEDSTVDFLSSVEAVARGEGVSLKTNTLEVSEEKVGGFNELIIKFALDGSESGVKNMIRTFETLPYYSRVNELNLVRKGSTQLSGSITVTLSLIQS